MTRPETKPRAPRRRRDNDIKMADISNKITKKAPTGPRNAKAAPRGLVSLTITGWKASKAANNADGGFKSLIQWLEKKASMRLGRRDTRIKKSRQDADAVVISVPSVDATAYERMNGYDWAGAKLTIKRVGGASKEGNGAPSSGAEETKAMLRGVLERRWSPDTKFLDLSALGADAELQATGIFGTTSTTQKFFPALMKVLELSFNSKQERDEAIEGVSLASNDLEDLKVVSTLSLTLPNLINLDISHNKFATLASLEPWRRRFPKLQHLIVTGNPIEQNQEEPNAAAEIISWFKNLRILNTTEVRSEEDLKNQNNVANLPFQPRPPQFQDEDGIVERFIRNWFAGFDSDRPALARMYYDEHSEFSFALNTQAPRDPLDTGKPQAQEWASYIHGSRNLKKLSQLPARQKRLSKGTQAVIDTFTGLPKTKHPDLATEPQKWLIESHIHTGTPDPINNTPGGVDGFFISIHGEFTEPETGKIRSCDHAVYIGPGGSTGVRVVSHTITIRAYGGTQAFQATAGAQTPPMPPTDGATNDGLPQLPAHITIELAEQMCAELTKRTGLNLGLSHQCLETANWDFDAALVVFQNHKANLPPASFIGGVPLM